MTPPVQRTITQSFEPLQETPQPHVMIDILNRLGNLEGRVGEFSPVLGRIAEGFDNMSSSVAEIKQDVKDMNRAFIAFQIESIPIKQRVAALEETRKNQEKDSRDTRGRWLAIIGTAAGSLVVGIVLYFLGR